MTRNHLRRVYETGEFPTLDDEEMLNKIKAKLDSEEIWYLEDMAMNVWYKLNKDERGREEIMIIGRDKSTTPILKYSRIVKNLGISRQIRLYIKPKDRENAEKVIKGASNEGEHL